METVRISKTAQQAFEWLGKMGIDVKPAIISGEMYEFEYKDILMFITVDTNDNELFLSAPVYLTGDTDERNKEIYEIAESMTREELKDYIVEYVKEALSYVGQVYVRPSHIRKMRRYQLLQMLDERGKNGTSEFEGEWIQFGSDRFPNWKSVLDYLLSNGE